MDIQEIQQYKSAFDLIEKSIKDDEGSMPVSFSL